MSFKTTFALTAVAFSLGSAAQADDHAGLGMQIVDKRLSNKFGRASALNIEVEPNHFTRMSFIIPNKNMY